MLKETLYYGLSTLAQSSAALLAFMGALVLFRLQSIEARRKDAYQDLRGLFVSIGEEPAAIALWPAKKLKEDARPLIERIYPPSSLEGLNLKRDAARPRFQEWENQISNIARDQRRTQHLLVHFGIVNLAVIALSHLGFEFIWALYGEWVTSVLFLSSVALVAISSFLVILEIVGSIRSWLLAFRLGKWYLNRLERYYLRSTQ
jgi:hypothetical protein